MSFKGASEDSRNVNIKSNITSPIGYDGRSKLKSAFNCDSEPNRNLQNAPSYFIQANTHVYIIVSFHEECTEICHLQKLVKFVYFLFSYRWICSNNS